MCEAVPQLLPTELILRVLEFLIPDTAIALRPSDPTAIAIKSWTLVCRATYPIALRLLYAHCLYINSSDRLRRLLIALEHHASDKTLSKPVYDYDTGDFSELSISEPNTLPYVDVRPCLQNVYLAAFPPYTIDDLPTAQWIFELFSIARHTMRRLVFNVPLDTLPAHRDHLNVRTWLGRALQELTNVEEFFCLFEGFDLPVSQVMSPPALHPPPPRPVWSKWKKLRRLALCANSTHEDQFFPELHRSLKLQHLLLFPRMPETYRDWKRRFRFIMDRKYHDVQVTYVGDLRRGVEMAGNESYTVPEEGQQRNLVQQAAQNYSTVLSRARLWNLERQEGFAKLKLRLIMVDEGSVGERNSEIGATPPVLWPLQAWMRDQAVGGCLWDLEKSKVFKQSQIDPALWFNREYDDAEWTSELLESMKLHPHDL